MLCVFLVQHRLLSIYIGVPCVYVLCVLCVCIYVSRSMPPFAKVAPLTHLGCICDATWDAADVPLHEHQWCHMAVGNKTCIAHVTRTTSKCYCTYMCMCMCCVFCVLRPHSHVGSPTPATTLMMGNTYTMDLSSLWGRKRATAQTVELGLAGPTPSPHPHSQRKGDEAHRKEGRVKVPQKREYE